jgi:M6 family metalloprotease-like protein
MINQRDGSVLNLFASGDEFFNWLHDANGYTIMLDKETGYYVYAALSGEELIPTKLLPGISDPSAFGLLPWLLPSDNVRRQIKLDEYGSNPPGEGDAPRIGTINNLVVFIRFADETEFTDSLAYYNNLFNNGVTGTNSLYNYFREVSYNQLAVTSTFYPVTAGTIVLSYQDTFVRNYYKPYDSLTNPIGYKSNERTVREHTLLKNAINYIALQVPASLNIDGDNDGKVDNVCFIASGSATAWNTLLWPHRWALFTYSVYINGKRVYDFNFQLQNFLKSRGVGVLCHEMFHSLGSPDLYHYTSNGIYPVYYWDLMEYDANPPQHMGAYMKWKYGTWISSIPIISSGTYSLKPVTSQTNNCYRVNSPYSASEYFVLEYRKKTGTFENSIPGTGLLVYRINTLVTGNASGPPDEVYIYRPNGTLTANGSPSSANYSSLVGRTKIDSTTNPSPFLSSGSQGGLIVSNIGNPDSTITFTVGYLTPPPAPVLINPANGSSGISLTPVLDWNDVLSAVSYRIQVSTDSLFGTVLWDTLAVTQSQTNIPAGKLTGMTKYFWRINASNAAGTGQYSTVWNFRTLQNLTLNLKIYLEGFWNGTTQVTDTVKVYLANSISPYWYEDSSKVLLSTNGTGTFNFTKCPNSNYYLVIVHRNHLETWSRLPLVFVTNAPVEYDFTTAQTQAYGNNLIYSNGKWCIYGGDINKDGFVDGADMALLDNDIYNYTSGRVITDLNGDQFVDGADMAILDNNIYNYIGVVRPGNSDAVRKNILLKPEKNIFSRLPSDQRDK